MDAARPTAKIRVIRHCQVTAAEFKAAGFQPSLYYDSAHARALNYDLIISGVDRPWPRAVLHTIASTDLVPVIDGRQVRRLGCRTRSCGSTVD